MIQSADNYVHAMRPARFLNVVERRNIYGAEISSFQDFVLTFDKICHVNKLHTSDMPYLYNARLERIFYTVVENPESVLESVFLYSSQRQRATKLVGVPLEQLDRLENHDGFNASLVFPIGRCGSTLLAAAIRSVGMAVVSEPDLCTQMAVLSKEEKKLLTDQMFNELLRICVSSMARLCGDEVFIKLRSQCINIAESMIQASGTRNVIYMFRNRREWANSRHEWFKESPEEISDILINAIISFANLVDSGMNPKIIWYEDLISDPLSTLSKIVNNLDPKDESIKQRIDKAMSSDSQAGTILSRDRRPHSSQISEFTAQFDAIWRKRAPRDLIAEHGMERLM